MPDITATNAGVVQWRGPMIGGASYPGWGDHHDDTHAYNIATGTDGIELGVRLYLYRGFLQFVQYWDRSFFEFDVSGISVAPSAATLKLYGRDNDTGDFFAVKGTQSGTIVKEDWDSIAGWDTTDAADGNGNGDQEAHVTKYSAEVTSWSTSGYNDITLTSAALSDIASLSTLKICLIESVHDLRDIQPANDISFLIGHDQLASAGKEITLSYTAGSTGYGSNVMGVASANIGSINGIATADIENGV